MEREQERLAGRVRRLRRERGFNQTTLAKEAGVARTTIARIETGAANPDLETLFKIAQALGVATAELLEE